MAVSEESGIAQSGLPLGCVGGNSAGCRGAAGLLGVISTGAGSTLLGGWSSAFGAFAPRASIAPASERHDDHDVPRPSHRVPCHCPATASSSRMRLFG